VVLLDPLFRTLHVGDVPSHVDRANRLAAAVGQRRDGDGKVTICARLVNLDVLPTSVLQQPAVRAEVRRLVGPVHRLVAELADHFFRRTLQPPGRRAVRPHDPVLVVQDEDQIRHGIERPLPDRMVAEQIRHFAHRNSYFTTDTG
jgi:hypothetical protein